MELRGSIARLVFHAIVSLHLGYALYYDYRYTELPEIAIELRLQPQIGGKFKYFTFLNGLLQFGYYLLALCQDIIKQRPLRKLKDYLLATFVLPLSLTVGITYWTLCSINRESICPKFLDLIYPKWLNQAQHTFVMIYALLELFVEPHRYPKRNKGLAGLGTFLISYILWMHMVYYWTGGVWIYPFLDALDGPLRLCFFLLILSAAFGYYLLGESLNNVLWKYRSIVV